MHLVGFIVRIYHDARSPERHIWQNSKSVLKRSDCDTGYKFMFQFGRNICVQFKFSLRFYPSEIQRSMDRYSQLKYGQTQPTEVWTDTANWSLDRHSQLKSGQTQPAEVWTDTTSWSLDRHSQLKSGQTQPTEVWTDTANRNCSTSPYRNGSLILPITFSCFKLLPDIQESRLVGCDAVSICK